MTLCVFSNAGPDEASLGSGAIIGIVVAAICVLLLIIAILIILLICRIRREALKNLRSRRGPPETSATSGCALPVDIPIEALARQPPPQYTPRAATTPGPVGEFNISILPPPYYAPGASAITEFSCAYAEAPPKYQSSNDLSKPTPPADHGKIQGALSESSVDRRRTSVDSFVDEPSMSNILLTSSRSSGLGFDSQRPSFSSCSNLHLNSCSPPRHSTGSSGSTSPVRMSSLTATSRSQSLSNILYYGSVEIPAGHEIQKTAGKERSVPPTRSVPCLHGFQGRAASGRSTDETSAEKPKQGKYRKKTSDERCSADSGGDRTPAAAGGGGGVRLHDPASSVSRALSSSAAAAHGLSTRRRISRSLPQLTILQEEDQPWREMESCDV